MFLIDKYTPKTIDDLYFHQEELKKLKIMAQDSSIPHIIFNGPEGIGKQTLIRFFLELLYEDPSVNITNDTVYQTGSNSSNKDDIIVKQSNYHIVIEPQNNNSDRYLIQDIVKEYAKKKLLFESKKKFKVVLINNIDNLSYHAQTSLRRTMEIYSDNCRFIMWSTSLSSILEPLRSRCNIFNVNRPAFDEQYIFLLQICYKEDIKYNYDFLMNIISRSNGNIKKLLWSLELTKLDIPIEGRHEQLVNSITHMLISTDINNLSHITDMIYDLIITNITPTDIMISIMLKLLKHNKISDRSKIKIVELVADHEHNLIRGRRDIIHMESMMINIMRDIYQDRREKQDI